MRLLRENIRILEKNFDLRAYLERFDHHDVSEEWSLDCPDCAEDDKHGKLWIRVDPKAESYGRWLCYRCGEAGGIFDLVQFLEGGGLIPTIDVLKQFSKIVDRADIRKTVERALAGVDPVSVHGEKEEICELPAEFVSAHEKIPSYFFERGISRQDALRYDLGHCTTGKYKNRLIVPVRRGGELRWFLGRWMAKKPPDGVKKYLNSFGSKSSRDLYGIDRSRKQKQIVLVEDVFSAIVQGPRVIATFGTHFSAAQLEILASTEVEEIVVCWDRDALDKAWKLGASLSSLWRVKVAEMPDTRDPDEISPFEFSEIVDRAEICGGASALRGVVRSRLG